MSDVLDKAPMQVVGTRPVRSDGVDKVTGRANYGADFRLPGMLTGRIKRSPHAHARIVSIDTRKALALRGVKAVITGADLGAIADQDVTGGEGAMSMSDIATNCLARDKVLYEGHAVAAVAAISPAIAKEALDLIEIVYEVLPHVQDVEEAMRPDAPVLHEGAPAPPRQQRSDSTPHLQRPSVPTCHVRGGRR
jgi:CO/xanthine dehydrogenase Mo-binding subunit